MAGSICKLLLTFLPSHTLVNGLKRGSLRTKASDVNEVIWETHFACAFYYLEFVSLVCKIQFNDVSCRTFESISFEDA